MDYSYVSFKEVASFGVDVGYLKKATNSYRQGKSKSWANIKDPNDKRKVLIDLETIPEPTRQKYNIPTGIEYFEQQELKAKIAEQEQKERKNELQASAEKRSLVDAYNNEWFQYLSIYRKMYEHNKYKCEEFAQKSAREHAFWLAMIKVTGNMHRGTFGKAEDGFKYMIELKKELVFTTHINNIAVFRRKLKEIRTELINGRCPSKVIGHLKKLPRPEQEKFNDFHKALILHYVSHEKKYSYRLCTDLINHHCIEEGQLIMSESYIKTLMATDNEFRTLVYSRRNGTKFLNENILPHASRHPVEFPANLWMIDGTPIQFFCKDARGRAIRLNLFVVLDAFSRKIVGFDISFSEDKFMVMNALKMAVQYEGHLPKEILSDNFSANKTDEIIAIKEQMIKLGVNWRLAKVGNPQDKTHVERFFGVFQSEECVLYDDYIGEGIQSKRDNRPNTEFLAKMTKKLLTIDQMKVRIVTMIAKYNERAKRSRKAPLELYKLPKPKAVEMDGFKTALMFWNRTKHTIKQGVVKITVNKTVHCFEIKSHKQKMQLQGKQVYVRYDENDLESIMLFDIKDETAICECKKSIGVYIESDQPKDGLMKHSAKVKSYKQEIEKQIQETYKKAFGDKEFQPIHPLDLGKNQINEQESREFIENTLQRMHINPINEEPKRKPQKNLVNGITVNSIDQHEKGTLSKKSSQRSNLKVVQN